MVVAPLLFTGCFIGTLVQGDPWWHDFVLGVVSLVLWVAYVAFVNSPETPTVSRNDGEYTYALEDLGDHGDCSGYGGCC